MPAVPAVVNVLMDLPPGQAYHSATMDALDHAATAAGLADGIDVRVVRTAAIDGALIDDPGHGVVVGPGSPYDAPERVLDVILSARERGIPLLGT
jgi:CTP synthase (UTP-ammonia lyase)